MTKTSYQIQLGSQYWTVNGSPDFGIIPGGTIAGIDDDAPIRLFVGNNEWGAHHIKLGHGVWLKKIKRTVPEALWDKCGQVGTIYRSSKKKCLFHMPLVPACMMILRYFETENFFSVTTLYDFQRAVQGTPAGRYPGAIRMVGKPNFALFTPPAVSIEVREKSGALTMDALDASIEKSKPRIEGTLSLGSRNKESADNAT